MAAQPPARRQIYTIACRCGALAAVHTSTFGRLQVCRSCRLSFTVAWRRDPKTQTLSPIVLAQARTRPAARRPSVPAPEADPAAPRMHLSCGCGYRRPIRPDEASRNTRCPGCGKWMIVEKTPARPARPSRSLPPAPPPPDPFPAAPPPAPPPPAPEPAERRSGGAPTCACGQSLDVGFLHAGSNFTCPSCGRSMKLQKARDPQTLLTVIRPVFVPRAEPPAPEPEPPPAAEEPASFLAEPPENAGAPGDDASFPAAPGPTQELFCRCGQEIVVGAADAGHPVQCPSCSVVLEVHEARDPQSGAAVLRVEVLGTLDQDWKLEDFA
ncbi:MAG TPA: hypothetical protein VNO22_00430 [Planctomycetota bacterium]|nr:hypothetical protein [Planctomycetota bacterium]